jgi:peptide/nickel transport system substrate-binding protein
MEPSDLNKPQSEIQETQTPLAPNQDIQPAGQPAPGNIPAQPPATVGSGSNKSGGLKKFLLIILALLLVGGVAYGIYSLTTKDKTDTKNASMSQKKDIPQLNVGVIGGSVTLYPESASDSYAQTISQQIYEGLVAYEDQTKIVPLLATGWNNPNDTTWDFDLRKNVTFHNGHTMKATDVVASLKASKEIENLGIYSDTLSEIKAINDYKVEIKTTQPDPFLLNKLSFLMILDATDIDAKDTMNATGPYKLKQGTKPTDSEIQLVAYDNYHGGHVYTRGLKIIDEADEVAATKDFKAGKINMVGEYNSSKPDGLSSLHPQQVEVNDPSVTFMTMNSVAPGPLQNLKVRQAIQYSIDKASLIKNINVSAEPASQLVTKAIPGYDPSINTSPTRDIAKAKQLLTEAGYPNGVTINIEASSVTDAPARELVKQAAEAGITLKLVVAPTFDDLVNDLIDGKTQTSVLSYSSDLQDGTDVFDTVLRQTNNYKSDALDKALDSASKTVDQEKRLKYLQQASKVTVDDVAALPLYNRQRTWFMDKPYAVQFESLVSDPGVYFYKVYLTN